MNTHKCEVQVSNKPWDNYTFYVKENKWNKLFKVCETSGTKTTWALSSSEKYKWILFSVGQSGVKYKSRQTGEEAQRQHGGHNTRHGHRWLPPVCCWNTSIVSPSSISSPWGVSFSDIGCPSNLNLTVVCTSFWNIMRSLQ